MNITIVSPGKTRKGYLRDAIDDYTHRLSHSVKLDYKEVKVKGQSSKQPDPKKEADTLLAQIPEGAFLVCLDIKGQTLSSEKLSEFIQQKELESTQHICFLIGGPVGLDQSLLNRADFRFSFSPMTFTHDMSRFLLVEQLYRAYAIKNSTGYHK